MTETAPGTIQGFTLNSGQACEAGTRVYVHEDIYDEFNAALAERVRALTMGPGNDPASDITPPDLRGTVGEGDGLPRRRQARGCPDPGGRQPVGGTRGTLWNRRYSSTPRRTCPLCVKRSSGLSPCQFHFPRRRK
ncbi:aldehyde dehydrogenase family protein [Paenarthrobacter nitroguajacolicus]|uniref:aldehyde dehydrogenase family protein n=1 Tax=Paenarthrobacter nitroguajacolicus TaxID=211146 RepID=UPI00211768F1|nr:aldehyde dehydrogenase family protein [Paenarthrobacter nitroguajacolicus]